MYKYLDIKLLREYTSGKTDLIITTLEAIIKTFPEDLNRIRTALVNQDFKRIQAITHRIKPNFELICSNELISCIHQIESIAQQKQGLMEIVNIYKQINTKIELLIIEAKSEVIDLKAKL